ncbi:MAG: ribosomal protein S18-alanine N-acetyltransferase [Firmicutes bacterium]|nr:ribosomal protein S18-alanine N-acetyltransferase [Candidatus Fiminaster equi]
MIKYRLAKQEDFEQVLEIENECFKQPYTGKELEYEFNENPVNKIIVAEFEEKIIGFIDFLITFNSSTIMQVAVTNKFRGQGIATQLLSEMEHSFPKEIDDVVETITLEVRESNEAAKALYLKNGYELVVVKKNYYKDGENALYMLKRL